MRLAATELMSARGARAAPGVAGALIGEVVPLRERGT